MTFKKLAIILIISGIGVLALSIIIALGIWLPINDFDLKKELPHSFAAVLIGSILMAFLGLILYAIHYRHAIISEVKRLYNN